MSAFNTFRKKAITVIVETKQKSDKELIGPLIDGAFGDPKMGNTIPKLVAASPNDNEIWGRLTYAQLGSSKNLKNLTKSLTAIQKGEEEAPADIKFPLRWAVKDKPGYAYTGDFVKLEGGKIHLKDKGKTHGIPTEKFAPSALAYAKKLAGLEEEKKAEAAKPKEEDWTNSAGKKIVATFIAIKGDKITLKLSNGKQSTFPLTLLSKESIERAKGYAK